MLRWQNEAGTGVEIGVRGYQFPHILEDWDANWLNIYIHATHGKKSFETVDPCFLTQDIVRLRKWLQDILDNVTPLRFTEFGTLEPNVAIEYQGRMQDHYRFIVILSAECKPQWSGDASWQMEFNLSAAEIAETIRHLDEATAQFPHRGMPGDDE